MLTHLDCEAPNLRPRATLQEEAHRGTADLYLSSASFWWPEYIETSAWIEHAPFAFWLISVLRPRSFLELGTHGGYSYFAMCQAVKSLELGTRCYAVDHWKGDEHAGFYGEEIFARVEAYNNKHYSAFSRLVRSTFDEAVTDFPDGSIDLLHIDGRHFYEDVRHDFETWRPKLSNRAVVIFHDTDARERGFGVYRLWAELCASYPSFEFYNCFGLGVLAYGVEIHKSVAAFLEAAKDEHIATTIRRAYARLGGAITAELKTRARLSAFEDEVTQRRCEVAEIAAELEATRLRISEVERDLDASNDRLNERFREIAMLSRLLREKQDAASRAIQDAEWMHQAAAVLLGNGGWRSRIVGCLPGYLARILRRIRIKRFGLFDAAAYPRIRLKRLGLFDEMAYLRANPDVEQTGGDALRHYINHGFKKGRRRG